MKKTLFGFLTILSLFILIPSVKAENTTKVYMFTKDGCPACQKALEYFNNLLKKEKFELVELEIFDSDWNEVSDDAYNLMVDTLDHFGESTEPSDIATPLIVIGDFHTIGLPGDTSTIESAIKDAKETDIVKQIAEDKKIDYQSFTKVHNTNESKKNDAIIIVVIFVVLIGGFAGLVLLGKK